MELLIVGKREILDNSHVYLENGYMLLTLERVTYIMTLVAGS